MIEHVCELPLKQEYKFPSVILQPLNFKNLWKTWCGISKYTPKCDHYMENMVTVTAERKRHFDLKYWWIIHPFSYARFLWDTLMIAIYSIAFLTIPFMICFVVMDYELIRLDKLNIPIYTVCWLDILLNCITGYHDRKNAYIELEPTKILLSYLKRFLLPDVLSSLPYDHITLPWRKLPGSDPSHIVTLMNIMPLLKLTRYSTLDSNISYLFSYLRIKNFYYQLYIMLLLGLYLVCWLSCLCYLIPILVMYLSNFPPEECKDCWMIRLKDSSLTFKFKNALLIVLQNILGNGYGLLIPETNSDIILTSILMVIGRCIVCYILKIEIICSICLLVTLFRIKAIGKASQSKFYEVLNQLEAYVRKKQFLPYMKKRLLVYYRHRFKNSYFHENKILASLSEPLREEVALQSCRRLIDNVPIFKNVPMDVLKPIVQSLKFELYLPNDVIAKAGSQGDCMFFISSGTVAVLTPTGKEICHLDDGAHFGEVALLVADQRRIASVIAIEVCEIYRFDRKDFRRCVSVHSELFAEIERIATERVDRTVRIEEQHKRFMMHPSYIRDYLYSGDIKKFEYM